MGAWNYGIFDDDSTCDALCALSEAEDTEFETEQFLDQVIISSQDYIDYDIGACGLAAAAVIDAKLNGTDYGEAPDDGCLDAALDGLSSERAAELAKKAARTVALLLDENSELNELWQDNEEMYPLWKGGLERLIERLGK